MRKNEVNGDMILGCMIRQRLHDCGWKGRARILEQRIGRRVGGKNNQHDAYGLQEGRALAKYIRWRDQIGKLYLSRPFD